MYVTSNQGRPVQGVSQQPSKNRHPGQCTLSDNFRPDLVKGLKSRQGTQTKGVLTGASKNPLSKWHYYKRNDEEYFIEIQPSGVLKAWSPDGTVHSVTVEDSAGTYLACTDPSSTLEMLTIGDYTFIINKEVVVAAGTAKSPALPKTAIVYVQYIDYTQTVRIYLDGVMVAWHTSKDGAEAPQKASVNTNVVAAHLAEGLQGLSGTSATTGSWGGTNVTANYGLSLNGNCLFITRADGVDFTISVNDEVNNSNSIAIYKEIEKVTLLPNKAPTDFKVKVNPPGGETTENASYWLKATATDGSSGNTLQWEESMEPGIVLGYNLSTMPYVLVRESILEGVATFTLRQGEWEDREVGDDDNNPLPAFVGEKLKTVGVMQNRLYFTAGESVTMSRSGHFFNFFRATSQATLDTDPISVYADSEQVNYLEAAVGFDGDLVFFSESAQFVMPGDKALTSANAVLRKTTNFETNLSAKPVASGDSILFAINYGQYTGVREYFTDSVTDTKVARPITDHVNEFIKGNPKIIAASTNLNILAIKADDDNVIYTYDWVWQGTDKVQSAWGRWLFTDGDEVVHFAFEDDKLKIIMFRDGTSIVSEEIDLGDSDSTDLTFGVRLDRQLEVTFTYDENDKVWKATDYYTEVSEGDIKAVRSTGCYEAEIGETVTLSRVGPEWQTSDDLGAGATVTLIMGVPIYCTYVPSNPVVKDQNNQAMNLDKLTIGAFYINYNTTGGLTATVTDSYGRSRISNYGNRVFGAASNIIGFAPLVEGQHRIPIRANSDKFTLTIETSSHIPLTIRDFSFNGNWNRRGQRI
ncbi:MAG: hypothetical protein M0P41_09365 [Sphaerochaeta sp.]|nr:hypothetical protein [Sphaerochaeta sp.]